MASHKRKGDSEPQRGLKAAARRWKRELTAQRIDVLKDKLRNEAAAETEKPLIRALRNAIEADPRTINAIAVDAELSAAAVWRFVEGKRSLSLSSAAALAETLGLELRLKRARQK